MKKTIMPLDSQGVFCEVCVKPVRKSEALLSEGRDSIAYFCGPDCYETWLGARGSQPPPDDVQEGSGGRSKSRDDRVKRIIRQHPQRDEPRADSVEPDDLPR